MVTDEIMISLLIFELIVLWGWCFLRYVPGRLKLNCEAWHCVTRDGVFWFVASLITWFCKCLLVFIVFAPDQVRKAQGEPHFCIFFRASSWSLLWCFQLITFFLFFMYHCALSAKYLFHSSSLNAKQPVVVQFLSVQGPNWQCHSHLRCAWDADIRTSPSYNPRHSSRQECWLPASFSSPACVRSVRTHCSTSRRWGHGGMQSLSPDAEMTPICYCL